MASDAGQTFFLPLPIKLEEFPLLSVCLVAYQKISNVSKCGKCCLAEFGWAHSLLVKLIMFVWWCSRSGIFAIRRWLLCLIHVLQGKFDIQDFSNFWAENQSLRTRTKQTWNVTVTSKLCRDFWCNFTYLQDSRKVQRGQNFKTSGIKNNFSAKQT